MKFAIIGAGKVGKALARLLAEAGWEFVGAASRSDRSARDACRFAGSGCPAQSPEDVTREAQLTFITTPDDAIAEVCAAVAARGGWTPGQTVAHCSGALSSLVLEPAREAGARVGSLHPLQSFASARQALRLLPGSHCCLEGDPQATEQLEAAARAMGARPFRIATEAKPLYHAAAVMACNYLIALADGAVELASEAGLPRREALEAFLPLVRGTVENLAELGLPDALTGPIARGDVETLRRHLAALKPLGADLNELYRVLGRATVRVARARGGISAEQAAQIMEMLESDL